MRQDTCARCGRRIHLYKVDTTTFRWLTDPDKPDTWRCEAPGLRVNPSSPQRHAPVSAQAARR